VVLIPFSKICLRRYGTDKSRFPNPFSILNPISEVYYNVRVWCTRKPVDVAKTPDSDSNDEVDNPHDPAGEPPDTRAQKDRSRQLESFQEKHTERHAEYQEWAHHQTDTSRIKQIQQEHDRVRRHMEELHTQTQRLDTCVMRTYEKVVALSDYSVYHTGELLKRIADLKGLVFSKKTLENVQEDDEEEDVFSSADYQVLPGFESRYAPYSSVPRGDAMWCFLNQCLLPTNSVVAMDGLHCLDILRDSSSIDTRIGRPSICRTWLRKTKL
jgi:hypothetical protein